MYKKTSYLAVLSMVLGFVGLVSFFVSLLSGFFKGVDASAIISSAALLLAVLSVITIYLKALKGLVYIAIAVILSLPSVTFVALAKMSVQQRAISERINTSRYNLRLLGGTMVKYAENNSGHLPDANQWCDSLMGYNKTLTRQNFKHPRMKEYDCNIAFNKYLSGLKLSEIPEDTVLLFEADGSWNLSGDIDLFEKRFREQKSYFSYILLVSGDIETYRFEEKGYRPFNPKRIEWLKPLRWKP
jgi:hypothetical protein